MTNISFYHIKSDRQSALTLACKLAEKAWRQDIQVLIHTDDETAIELDKLMWSFSASAFLPHGNHPKASSDIAITSQNDPGDHHDLLISLSKQTPDWFSRFEKVAEIIYEEPEHKASKRESFKQYKNKGYPLQYHELSPA